MVRYVHSAKWPSASQRGNAVVRHGRHLRWIHHLLGLQSTDIRFIARWRELARAGVYCRFGSALCGCDRLWTLTRSGHDRPHIDGTCRRSLIEAWRAPDAMGVKESSPACPATSSITSGGDDLCNAGALMMILLSRRQNALS